MTERSAEPALATTVLDEERAIMNDFAPLYRNSIETAGFVYRRERSTFGSWMLDLLRADGADIRSGTVLDVGCGTGEGIEALIEAGCERVVGLDLAEGMLRQARTLQPDGLWVQGLVERPPFAADSFSVVVATFTLHHLFDPADLFALIDGCLSVGGRFFLLEYGDLVSARKGGPRGEGWLPRAGDRARALIRRKNERELRKLHDVEIGFNSAHRPRTWQEIRDAMRAPDRYELTQCESGVLLPAFKRELVESSGLDRGLAGSLDAIDRWLAPKLGGYFQWISGRRRTD